MFENREDVEKGLEAGSRVAVDELDAERRRDINVLGAMTTGRFALLRGTGRFKASVKRIWD